MPIPLFHCNITIDIWIWKKIFLGCAKYGKLNPKYDKYQFYYHLCSYKLLNTVFKFAKANHKK